ncbi:MAG: hypothetical protein LUE31_12280, partial [Lachnospiraceae bacterium]|nr:hypothetical protein [Lachnospiraceae bacterium]
MNSQKLRSERQFKRTAIYIAPIAYCDPVDLKSALKMCKGYVRRRKNLKLMRIYRDEKVEIIGNSEEDKLSGKRSCFGAEGNDAWNRLLKDIETSAIEAVVIYAARTVAPTIYALSNMLKDYFIPCGVRFIDVEAEFDTAVGDADSYIKEKVREYRSNLKRKPYKKRKNKEAEIYEQTEPSCKIDTALSETDNNSTVAYSDLCQVVS